MSRLVEDLNILIMKKLDYNKFIKLKIILILIKMYGY